MKNSTVTMFTGSHPLLQIVSIFLTAWLAACTGSDESSNLLTETLGDYVCKDKCDRAYFKPFNGQSVHLEIEPTGELSQVFYNIDPGNLSSTPLVLKSSVLISGQAVGADKAVMIDSIKRDKPSRFNDIVALPQVNSIRFLSPQSPMVKTGLGTDAKFSMEVLAGLSYSFILNPSGSHDRAPFYINTGIINDSKQLEFNIDNDPINLTGRIVAKDQLISPNGKEELLIAKVMQGNRLVSSIGSISADGRFSLEISNPLVFEDQMPINLIVLPMDSESALPEVRISLKPEDLSADLDIRDIDLGGINKPISTKIEVHGSDSSLIAKAYLFLNAKIGIGEALVKKPVDPSGVTKLNKLYEGVYDVAVVPSSDSPFAMKLVKSIKFEKGKENHLSITLPKRRALNAVVFAPTGIPVSGAQIEFSRIGEEGLFATEDIYDDMLFKLIASTDDQGKICHRRFGFKTSKENQCQNLLLDDGRYLAHIIPPAGSQLAHKWITLDFPKESDLVINLDQPQVLSGQILAHDRQTPVKRAFITIYLPENGLGNQPRVIGNAITDERGFFKAFVSKP